MVSVAVRVSTNGHVDLVVNVSVKDVGDGRDDSGVSIVCLICDVCQC